jgi:delta 1-pyrroline-5-carboxylate dehydrogenase
LYAENVRGQPFQGCHCPVLAYVVEKLIFNAPNISSVNQFVAENQA